MKDAPDTHIIAVGDISFNGNYHRLLKKKDPHWPFSLVKPHWDGAAFVLGNLESPITCEPKATPRKLTLRAPLQAAKSLRAAEFGCVSLANNHMMDFGFEGLRQTENALASVGIKSVGGGQNIEAACTPAILDFQGNTVAVCSYCCAEQESPLFAGMNSPGVAPLDETRCKQQIQRLKQEADWIILKIHWGLEMAQLPSPAQRKLAKRLIEAGADVILGHHPHVLQPMEFFEGRPVFYSLGNFMFSGMYWSGCDKNGKPFVARHRLHPLSYKTGWIDLVLSRGALPKAQFHPARLRHDLRVMPDHESHRVDEWNQLNSLLQEESYDTLYEIEALRARQRTAWRYDWESLSRRLELKLFKWGLIPFAPTE